jgi:hypothetical protein
MDQELTPRDDSQRRPSGSESVTGVALCQPEID